MTFHEALERLRVAWADVDIRATRVAALFNTIHDLLDSIPAPPSEGARAIVVWEEGFRACKGGCNACSCLGSIASGVVTCMRVKVCGIAGRHVDLRGPGCPWYEEGK